MSENEKMFCLIHIEKVLFSSNQIGPLFLGISFPICHVSIKSYGWHVIFILIRTLCSRNKSEEIPGHYGTFYSVFYNSLS